MANIVDSMMMEMEQNNSQLDMNYQPEMMASPIQHQQQVRMGEVQYMPQQQMPQQIPTMQQQMNPAQLEQMMMMQQQMMQAESPETPDMEAPDLSKYGMEEEDEHGWFDMLIDEAKAPMIVVILAFLMSMPQVNATVRNGLSRFTMNTFYINIIQSLLIGLAFYLATKFLV